MALFKEDEPTVTRKEPIPVVTDREYRSHVVDTRYEPAANLITKLPGFPYAVDWYGGVLDVHDPLVQGDRGRTPDNDQRYRVRAFEIHLDSEIGSTQDAVSKEINSTGVAYVHPCVIPNTGDVFIGDIGDGRAGYFEVTGTERLSRFVEAAHRIEFKLVDYVTDGLLFDIQRKVVKTYHFRREYLNYGQSPLIEDEVIGDVRFFEERYKELSQNYLEEFWSREHQTLLVPGQFEPHYDPYVASHMNKLYMTSESPYFQNMRLLNVFEDDHYRSPTILDVLVLRRPMETVRLVRKVGKVSVRLFDRKPSFSSVYYSRIPWIMYPSDDAITTDYQYGKMKPKSAEPMGLVSVHKRVNEMKDVFSTRDLSGFNANVDAIPLIKPVMVDDYYIFSEAFYKRTEGEYSLLEQQAHTYINKNPVNPQAIKRLVDSQLSWDPVERFYYTPVLLALVFAALRTI